jgi:hypothetical protein
MVACSFVVKNIYYIMCFFVQKKSHGCFTCFRVQAATLVLRYTILNIQQFILQLQHWSDCLNKSMNFGSTVKTENELFSNTISSFTLSTSSLLANVASRIINGWQNRRWQRKREHRPIWRPREVKDDAAMRRRSGCWGGAASPRVARVAADGRSLGWSNTGDGPRSFPTYRVREAGQIRGR